MSVIIMILLISVLIIVHELGHFLAAKSVGINPERFGIGLPFGPTLYERKCGDTIFCIHAFLLGGYVSFPEDNPDNDVSEDDPSRLDNHSLWQRTWVISAGVIANAVAAFVLVLIVAFLSGGLPVGKYNIAIEDLYTQSSTSAKQSGIMPQDKIVKFENIDVTNPAVFIALLQENKEANGVITQSRLDNIVKQIYQKNTFLMNFHKDDTLPDGIKIRLPKKSFEASMTEQTMSKINRKKIKIETYELTQVEQDLRDKIYEEKIYSVEDDISILNLAAAVADGQHSVALTVKRDGKNVVIDGLNPNRDGLIGVKLFIEEIAEPTNNIKDGIVNSWNYLYLNTSMMLKGLGSIFTGKIPLGELHGIIAIAKVGGDIIQYQGIWKGILLTAIISMNLAIINILPIPALDGGHLFFLLIEGVTGKKVDPKTQENIAKYGFLFLIILMFFVIFNDIFALITNKF